MSKQHIAHISDLHIGSSPQHAHAAKQLCKTLLASDIDHVIVTGDITEHGRASEFVEFKKIFQTLAEKISLVIVPGNHDCLNDTVAKEMMSGERVDVVSNGGISVIRLNTTRWFNRFRITGHGTIDQEILSDVDRVFTGIPETDFVIMALHHHLLPLPDESFLERLSSLFRFPFTSEIANGSALLEKIKGRCDLVLHGHRHVSSEVIFPHLQKTLRVYNAGSSTLIKKFRRFVCEDGKLVGDPVWIQTM